MKTVILLMIFAIPPYTQPVRPHEMLRFYRMEDCVIARDAYRWWGDGEHAYACLRGVVVD